MTITAALLVGKMAMHTKKADETLLHHAHVTIPNCQYSTEGQLHDSESSHLNSLKAKKGQSCRCAFTAPGTMSTDFNSYVQAF